MQLTSNSKQFMSFNNTENLMSNNEMNHGLLYYSKTFLKSQYKNKQTK